MVPLEMPVPPEPLVMAVMEGQAMPETSAIPLAVLKQGEMPVPPLVEIQGQEKLAVSEVLGKLEATAEAAEAVPLEMQEMQARRHLLAV